MLCCFRVPPVSGRSVRQRSRRSCSKTAVSASSFPILTSSWSRRLSEGIGNISTRAALSLYISALGMQDRPRKCENSRPFPLAVWSTGHPTGSPFLHGPVKHFRCQRACFPFSWWRMHSCRCAWMGPRIPSPLRQKLNCSCFAVTCKVWHSLKAAKQYPAQVLLKHSEAW